MEGCRSLLKMRLKSNLMALFIDAFSFLTSLMKTSMESMKRPLALPLFWSLMLRMMSPFNSMDLGWRVAALFRVQRRRWVAGRVILEGYLLATRCLL